MAEATFPSTLLCTLADSRIQQECIPVGCVPPTAVAAEGMYPSMNWAGGVYPSMHWAGGYVCIPACTGQGGMCVSQHALGRGVSAQGVSALEVSAQGRCLPGVVCYGGVCPRGVSARGCLPRGCLGVCLGGVCLGGCMPWGVSATPPRLTHTPVNRITDACENITLPQLRCGR